MRSVEKCRVWSHQGAATLWIAKYAIWLQFKKTQRLCDLVYGKLKAITSGIDIGFCKGPNHGVLVEGQSFK
jgi:hypothetical protein